MLLAVMKGLMHRAHVLCDLKEVIIELSLLKDAFISNWYPKKLVLSDHELWRH